MKKIVIAGGTGFIGKYLKEKFEALRYNVVIISRQKSYVSWDDHQQLTKALNDAELLINLAGKSVNCRYNEKNKVEIIRSRTETTTLLGEAIQRCAKPPQLWINAGTATIYRHAEDRPMTESNGEIGTGFSVDVAKAWEKAFFSFQLPHTRQVLLRIAIVLGKDDGVMKPYTNLVRFGLGGKQGNGRQMFSWIHIEDLFNIILFLHQHTKLAGILNCAAPNPVTNKTFMQKLRKAMHVKIGLPSPKWLLELGAIFIKTETELVLKSRWVLPERLLNDGYTFHHPTLDEALPDLLKITSMETTDKIMIYDDACPMCAAYTKAFVSTGLLSGAGRQSFSNADSHLFSQIDVVKSRHEIPLIDTKNNTILYGIDAMLDVMGNKLPLVKIIGTYKPVSFFLKKLYKLIFYNRRVITASAAHSSHFDCTPDFNLRYRILLLCIGFCFNTLMLAPTYHHVFAHSIFNGASATQLQWSHLAFVGFNIFLATRLSLHKAIGFLGQVNLVGMIYSLLVIPLILINHLFIIPHVLNTILLFAIFFFMMIEYRRRMRYAGILHNTWIVVMDAIASVLFISYLAFA